MKSLVLFNNKGGVGKTTLGYHIAHMMARRGLRVVVLDYDPQCNISAAFLRDEELEELWGGDEAPRGEGRTVFGCLENVRRGMGELLPPRLHQADDNLWLLPGHLGLSRFEQTLAEAWAKVLGTDNERELYLATALAALAQAAGNSIDAHVVLVDVGPSLGALNRSALLSCDAVALPVAPDLFSLQGLRNVGPTLRTWRENWRRALDYVAASEGARLPRHQFAPVGYIVQQHLARADRPIKAYAEWVSRIPEEYHRHVLGEAEGYPGRYELDPERIFLFRHYASLVPLALDARKPMFDLKRADGINGSLYKAVASCRKDVNALVTELAKRLDVPIGEEV
ncbi:MAG TPA: ParA family protein [Polyangiaceae bacterium]|nr:ParA family protein [Polyangiaceae bacterium]